MTLVGIDLGGTNIRAAVATGPTSHGNRVERRTPHDAGPDAVLAACAEAARESAGGELSGIAIGIPGPLDPKSGVVFATPHLAGWENVPARDTLERLAGCPVAIQNDASLAGYAEWVAGAGKGMRDFVFVTVSTGIGGALVIDGELYSGTAGSAAEIGHSPASLDGPPCGQGHVGCLEGMASGTAIARRARDAIAAGTATVIGPGEGGEVDAEEVAKAARGGDELALRLYGEAGRALGRSFGGVINLLGPDVIVVGGGMINNADLLMPEIHRGIAEIAFAVPAAACRIELAALGTDAGLVGATAWAVRSFQNRQVATDP